MKKILQTGPIFLLLLPVFFVLHGSTENFDAVPLSNAMYLLGIYLFASLIIFLLSQLFYRNTPKAALFTFCIMAFHFFFGGIQDFLKKLLGDSFLTHYFFLLPSFLIIFIILTVYLKKRKKSFLQISFYLNILLLLLIIIDTASLIQKSFYRKEINLTKSPTTTMNCDTCIKPDIYFLLFDEYSSSTALKELWNYDNGGLDTFLKQKGFSIQSYSHSNYNFTPFSMASTLNMEYLSIPDPKACTVKDYSTCFDEIKKNKICSFLQSSGYKIVNYSIFDLDKSPSPVTEDFLPLKTKLITSQTFLSRIKKDLFYHLLTGRFEIPWLSKDLIYTTYNNNEKIITATLKESTTSSLAPRFVYSHIEMPHPPFYYTKQGKQTDKKILIEESNNLSPDSYLGYIPRTNEVIKQIINSILDHAKRPVVIVLMGDHGFRTNQPASYHFRNQNAVYISFKNMKDLYPSISNVNEFRVLLNDLFRTNYPLLKDSTEFLIDK